MIYADALLAWDEVTASIEREGVAALSPLCIRALSQVIDDWPDF